MSSIYHLLACKDSILVNHDHHFSISISYFKIFRMINQEYHDQIVHQISSHNQIKTKMLWAMKDEFKNLSDEQVTALLHRLLKLKSRASFMVSLCLFPQDVSVWGSAGHCIGLGRWCVEQTRAEEQVKESLL